MSLSAAVRHTAATAASVARRTWLVAAILAAVVLTGIGFGIAALAGSGESRLTGDTLARASEAALAELGPGQVTDARHREPPGPPYSVETRLANGVEVTVQLDQDFAVVWASAPGWVGGAASVGARVLDEAQDASVDRTSAQQAALAEVGGGIVTGFARSTALDHAFEVEVTLANGEKRIVKLTERSQIVRPKGSTG